MVPGNPDPAAHIKGNPRQKGKKKANTPIKKQPARRKKESVVCVPRPEDLSGEARCNYPEWQNFLRRYPMINSLQREDFPEQGVSFVYVAHIYCTDNTAEESSLSQKEYEDFFSEIGYEYDYSGNFESRWFEGIGVKIN
jgi:hypothetical protein